MRRERKIIFSALFASILITGTGVGLHYSNITNQNNQNFDSGELVLKQDYNKDLTKQEIMDGLLGNEQDSVKIDRSYLSAFIELDFFPEEAEFTLSENRIDYEKEELVISFLTDKIFDENKKVVEEFVEYTISLKMKMPFITDISPKKEYDKDLNKYQVLDNLTGSFSSTDEINKEELSKYINLSDFPKDSKFRVAFGKQHFDEGKLEIGFEVSSHFDEQRREISEEKAYSFIIDASMFRATKIIESSKYSEETRTLEQIKSFLLKNPKTSNEIDIKKLSKYLIIDNINEYTKFYLDNISLKSGFGGFVNIELSYTNFLNNAGETVPETRNMDFMVLTTVDHNATAFYRNKNNVNSRSFRSTVNFLKGDISGENIPDSTTELDREALSQWFTIRNVPEEAIFTLGKYGYGSNDQGGDDKNTLEIEFSVDRIFDKDGNIKFVSDIGTEEGSGYQFKGGGTIPVHVEKTTFSYTGLEFVNLSVYELKNSLIIGSDNRMSYSTIKEYMTISDIPTSTKFYFENIVKIQTKAETETEAVKVNFRMDRWYDDGEVVRSDKHLNFNVSSVKSFETDLKVKANYKQSITKDGFETKLLEGSPGNKQIDTNRDFFKSYFDFVPSKDSTVFLDRIDDETGPGGGILKVHFRIKGAIDDNGAPIGKDVLKTCHINYQDLFNFESATGTIIGLHEAWKTEITELVIPQVYKNTIVSKIGNEAFDGNKKIQTIVLPDTLTSIGDSAFRNCTSIRMETLVFDDKVLNPGKGIFEGLSATHFSKEISVPLAWDDLSTGWKSGFIGVNYRVRGRTTSLSLPSTSTSTIKRENIATSLTGSVSEIGTINNIDRLKTYIGDDVFKSYPTSTIFKIESSSKKDDLTQRLSISTSKYWNDKGQTISSKKTSTIDISFDTTPLYNMSSDKTTILGFASDYLSQTELWNGGDITLPPTITKIGESAFKNTAIKSISNSEIVTFVDREAFFNCSSLKSINLPNVTNIGIKAFSADSYGELEHLTVSDKLKTIDGSAFERCSSLTSELNLDGVTLIRLAAFRGATNVKFKNLSFLDTMTSIQNYVFSGATKISGELSLSAAKSIGQDAFLDAESLYSDELVLEKTTNIGPEAFSGTYKKDSNDNDYIKSISVRGINDAKQGVEDLYTDHNSNWSQGYWNEKDGNVINLDGLKDEIHVGQFSTMMAIVDGVAYTWGNNSTGALGIGESSG
ncbi:MAG: leucine-rich repeat protein, partial [Mycoplasma sp.]